MTHSCIFELGNQAQMHKTSSDVQRRPCATEGRELRPARAVYKSGSQTEGHFGGLCGGRDMNEKGLLRREQALKYLSGEKLAIKFAV